MKRLITAMLLLALSSGLPLIAQPTATDLSYFPIHIGNIWVYELGVTPLHDPRHILRYERVEITHDTVLANGKRYLVMNGEIPILYWDVPFVSSGGPYFVRVDSLSGSVFKWRPSRRSDCADTSESEITRLVLDSTGDEYLCGGGVLWGVTGSTQEEQVGQTDTMRYRRRWWSFPRVDRYSEGIGLSSTTYGFTGTYDGIHGTLDYQLVYARIDGVQYFPVTFRSFHADLLPGNRVHLRWSTEQEERNAGFTVQRRAALQNAGWEDVGFVEARAPEGGGASYTFVDDGAVAWRSGTDLQYRLRQHDYDGTVSYSFVLDVRLSSTADSPELAAWPQPATDVLHLQLRVPTEQAPQLRISDMLGREVRLHRLEAGTPYWSWDLTDAAGGRVPPGLYLVSVRAGEVRMTRKVVVR